MMPRASFLTFLFFSKATSKLFWLQGIKTLAMDGHLYNGHLYTTDTSIQRTTLYNGHLCTTDISVQRTSLYNGHLYTTDISVQRTPLYNGHLFKTDTSVQRTSLYNGELHWTERYPLHGGSTVLQQLEHWQRPGIHIDLNS